MKDCLLPDPPTALATYQDIPSLRTSFDVGMMGRQDGMIWLFGLRPNNNGAWMDHQHRMKWRVPPLIPNSQAGHVGLGGFVFGTSEGKPMGAGPFGNDEGMLVQLHSLGASHKAWLDPA